MRLINEDKQSHNEHSHSSKSDCPKCILEEFKGILNLNDPDISVWAMLTRALILFATELRKCMAVSQQKERKVKAA